MDFENINKEMIEIIEEQHYMNFIYKACKMFRLNLVSYNFSPYKSLQLFRKYGWKVSPGPFNDQTMDLMFEYHISHLNSDVEIHMVKNLKTGILSYDPFLPRVYMDVVIDDKNEIIFNTVKRLENVKKIGAGYEYGNDRVKYSIINLGEKYRMTIYYTEEKPEKR